MLSALLDRRLVEALSPIPSRRIRCARYTARLPNHRTLASESSQFDPTSDENSPSNTAGPSRSTLVDRHDPPLRDFETGVPRAFGSPPPREFKGFEDEVDPSEAAALKSLSERFGVGGTFGGGGKNAAQTRSDVDEFDLTQSFGSLRPPKRDRNTSGFNSSPRSGFEIPKARPFNSLQSLEESNFVESPRSGSSPRAFKGVRDRYRRDLGVAPREAQAFDEILQDMFKDLGGGGGLGGGTPGSGLGMGMGMSGAMGDPFGLGIGGVNGGRSGILGLGRGRKRIFSREESEVDQSVLEEVDKLKESMSSINDEVRLLAWARETVFTPISTDEFGPTFSKAYSRILAHLLKTVRENFDNPHLTLALFQYAQTHSLESYLSGCLAPTYNELLLVRWESFRDFVGVEQGVREMQMNGVPWDRDTQKIVGTVVSAVMAEVAAGEGGKSRWGMDIQERLKVLDELVQGDIDEREDSWNKQRVVKKEFRKSGGFGFGSRNEGIERSRDRGRETSSWAD